MDITRFALGGFKSHKDDELLVRGTTVLQAMNNNAFFPEPTPALEDVQALLDDFSAKLAVAKRKGSPADTAFKNASRKLLSTALNQLAFYVSQVARGELPVLLSSGFIISSYPRSGDVPEVIRGVMLRDARQSGQMRLDFSKQSKVLLYEYRYGQESDGEGQVHWSEPISTTSSRGNIIAPVAPHQRYQVQVRAVNTYGRSEWSDAVGHYVR